MFDRVVHHVMARYLLMGAVTFPGSVIAQEISGTFAGSHFPVASDYDGDGIPNAVTANETVGVSTVLGRFSSRSFGEGRFEGEFCSDSEVKLSWVADTAVYTAADGALLYAVYAGNPDSALCFNFLDSTFHAEIYLTIAGGTGRFAGATGELVVASTGVLAASGLGGFWQGTLSGDVALSRD